MILVCPLCQTKYLVQANVFANGPRQVRCARCKHGWQASLPNNVDVVEVAPAKPAEVPAEKAEAGETHTSEPRVDSNLPAVVPSRFRQLWLRYRLRLGAAFAVLVLGWLILDRQHIARHHTVFIPLYNAVGLHIYYPGDELEFTDVRSELKFDGGITKLNLQGKVLNKTKNNQKVPDIIAQALGSDGHVIQSWQIDAPQATLAPDEGAGFSSTINAPKGNVVNVNLNFVETKDDD